MTNRHVLVLALVYAGSSVASSALSVWQPLILKGFGLTDMQTGLANAIPFGIAAVLMVLWGRHSDRTGERVWHNALCLIAIVIGLGLTMTVSGLVPTMLMLTLALVGTYASKGPFWALSTEWLSAPSAAAGIAVINSLGTVGGFVSISLIGAIKDATGSYPLALLPIVVFATAGAVAMILAGRGQARSAVHTA